MAIDDADRVSRSALVITAARSSPRSGFTLVELVIIVLVFGALAAFAIPTFIKTSENHKSDFAKSILMMVANGNKMRSADGKPFATAAIGGLSPLVSEKYVAPQDWDGLPYSFVGADSPTSPCIIAKAIRRTSGAQSTSLSPYKDWVFCIDDGGAVLESGQYGGCGTKCLAANTPPCVSNGSCSAMPACGETASGTDNCGKSCVRTGSACCVSDGSCSAAPACGQTASGTDNCGTPCARSGPACCVSDGSCSAAPACGQTASGTDNCGTPCTRSGPACCVSNGSCSAAPACGQTASGTDNCGTPCTRSGPACCVSNGSCTAAAPACGQTTSGTDNCGTACTRSGTPCVVQTETFGASGEGCILATLAAWSQKNHKCKNGSAPQNPRCTETKLSVPYRCNLASNQHCSITGDCVK